jgi:hypothetical protein
MKAKRTCLPQRQTTTNSRQMDNAPERRNQSSILQKENKEITYGQEVANPNKEYNVQENEDVKETLQLMLDKLINL